MSTALNDLPALLEQHGKDALEAINPESDGSQEAAYFVTEEPLALYRILQKQDGPTLALKEL